MKTSTKKTEKTEKTLGRIYKDTIKNSLREAIKASPDFFVVRYRGLKSPEISQLRKELKHIGAKISVVRNRLSKSVLENLEIKDTSNYLKDPTAFVFCSKDPVLTSKSLVNFSKDHEKLSLEVAFIDKKVLDKSLIKALAALPPKEVLLARVIGGIKAPLSGLANVLGGTLRNLVSVLDQVAKQKKG